MAIVYLLLFYLIHNVHSTGEWATCTDENLSLAQQDIIDMDSEIRQLLMNNSVTITDNDELSIQSCESQVVAGTNYKLTTNFGIIQYFVGIPTDPDRVHRVPTNLQYLGSNTLCICTMEWAPVCYKGTTYGNECGAKCAGATDGTFTAGECVSSDTDTITGAYSDFTDLSTIQTQINQIKNDIITLLKDYGLDISDNALISIISAQSQIVAGVNYHVYIDIGCYTNVIIQYFIGLDENNQIPQHLQLISVGQYRIMSVGSYQDVSDLTSVANTVSNIDANIKQLLISEGLIISDSDNIIVVSAQEQVVAGINYIVTINIGSLYTNIIIKYFIGLDINNQTPQDLDIISLGDGSGIIIGGWSNVLPQDLDDIRLDVMKIESNLRELLINNNILQENDRSVIIVVSAQQQIVSGINYKVIIDVAMYEDVIISFYVPLISTDPNQIPIDLKLIDSGAMITAMYHDVTDENELKLVEQDVKSIEHEIILVLSDEGVGIADDAEIVVVSAQSQQINHTQSDIDVVVGTNYRVTMNIGNRQDVDIQYYIDSTVDGETRPSPQNIALISSGFDESETMSNSAISKARLNRLLIILAIVLLIIIAFVVAYSLWYKKRKISKTDEKYASLNQQEMSVTETV